MPIYEYECTSCHHYFDLLQKFNEPPVTICPKCGEQTVTKLISAAGFQLKGTGWYATDFKDKGKQPSSTSSGVHSSKDNSSSSGETTARESTPSESPKAEKTAKEDAK